MTILPSFAPTPLMPVLFAVSSAPQILLSPYNQKAQGVHIFCIRKFKPNLHAPLRLSEAQWVLHFYQIRLTGLFCKLCILFSTWK